MMWKRMILLLSLIVGAVPVSAQVAETQALQITATNVTGLAAERGDDPGVVLPGDVIEYRLIFTNTQTVPVQDIVFTDPIPTGLSIVLGSASADRESVVIEYSIDSGATYTQTPTVTVEEAGQTVRRPAPAAAYTHVRWTLTDPVSPGAQVTAQFRARADIRDGGQDR